LATEADPDPVEARSFGTDPPAALQQSPRVQPFFAKDASEDAAPMFVGTSLIVDQSLSRKAIDRVEVFSELPSRVIADFMGVRAPTDQALRGKRGHLRHHGPDPALPSCPTCSPRAGLACWLTESPPAG